MWRSLPGSGADCAGVAGGVLPTSGSAVRTGAFAVVIKCPVDGPRVCHTE